MVGRKFSAWCVGAALCVWGVGCAPRAQPTETSASADLARPAVDLAGLGLEVRGWVVDNRDHRLARALAQSELEHALTEAGDQAWRSCGVRVVEVATSDLPALHARLSTGPEQRVWLGQTPAWTSAYEAAETRTRTGVRMPEGELALEAGELRLLVRAWVERRIGSEGEVGRLRVDLVPQNRERAATDLTLEPVDPTRPLETGLVFERLRSTWTGDGTRALLLAPAEPEEDWQDLARVVGPVEDEGVTPGPFAEPLPTLGEALLGTSRRGYRIVLVLIPRTSVESPGGR